MALTKKDEEHVRALVKEAVRLSSEIGAMDKMIEGAISEPNNALAEWLAGKAVDKAAEETLEAAFKQIFKVLGVATTWLGVGVGAAVDLLHSQRQPSKRMAYLDTRPQLATAYDQSVARLKSIQQELFLYMPPSSQTLAIRTRPQENGTCTVPP